MNYKSDTKVKVPFQVFKNHFFLKYPKIWAVIVIMFEILKTCNSLLIKTYVRYLSESTSQLLMKKSVYKATASFTFTFTFTCMLLQGLQGSRRLSKIKKNCKRMFVGVSGFQNRITG